MFSVDAVHAALREVARLSIKGEHQFLPEGVAPAEKGRLYSHLLTQKWVVGETSIRGNGVIGGPPPTLTAEGREVLDALDYGVALRGAEHPSATEAWDSLLTVIDPLSAEGEAVMRARNWFDQRGILDSDGSVARAIALAAALGLGWSAQDHLFARRGATGETSNAGGEARGNGPTLRVLLFTDIVESTEQTFALGDDRWAELREGHHEMVRGAFASHGGKEWDDAGDGFLATFESVRDAVTCAFDIVDGMVDVGLEARLGLHLGDVLMRPKPVGRHVPFTARVMAAAGANQIFVSEALRAAANFDGYQTASRHLLTVRTCREAAGQRPTSIVKQRLTRPLAPHRRHSSRRPAAACARRAGRRANAFVRVRGLSQRDRTIRSQGPAMWKRRPEDRRG